ncbi:MAG: class I SAM-dependent methyltransferase [Solirubrobacteraceae bacterium]
MHSTEGPGDAHAERAAATYGAAADHYCRASLGFWDRFGAATVSRLALSSGTAVLDLCCGAGASALPAARAVAPAGRVLGIDVAGPLLDVARARAAAEGLDNVEFRRRDARATGLLDGAFDVVMCVFGIFFAADMPGFVTEMWRLVRPGGRLAVTTWGPGLFEPANSVFWESVRDLEPSLYRGYAPWDEITTPEALGGLLAAGGAATPALHAASGSQPLARPEDFWDVVLGSGYRATVDALSPPQRTQLRDRVVGRLREDGVTEVRTDVVFAIAERPA